MAATLPSKWIRTTASRHTVKFHMSATLVTRNSRKPLQTHTRYQVLCDVFVPEDDPPEVRDMSQGTSGVLRSGKYSADDNTCASAVGAEDWEHFRISR